MKEMEKQDAEGGAEGGSGDHVTEIMHAEHNPRDRNAKSEKKQGD
jgi:hypothetical protein